MLNGKRSLGKIKSPSKMEANPSSTQSHFPSMHRWASAPTEEHRLTHFKETKRNKWNRGLKRGEKNWNREEERT